MDLAYLLWLQQLREATGNLFTPLMEGISALAASPILIGAVVFVYWAVNKKLGSFLMLNYTGSTLLNQTVKLGVCAYRPWIRDSRIVPAGDSITSATGYSFPSGHSQSAAAYYGSLALWFGKKHRWVAWLMGAMILLTGFSRNYLGVHTPQDVVVGIGLCFVYLALNARLMAWLERNPRGDALVAAVGCLLAAGCVAFFLLKSYPMDYVNGALLVDPEEMMEDGFAAAGMVLGFFPGWLLERRFFPFSTDRIVRGQRLVSLLGLIPLLLLYKLVPDLLAGAVGGCWAELIGCAAAAFYAMALVPLLLHRMQRRAEMKNN